MMMSQVPLKNYEVYDLGDLDDLILHSKLDAPPELFENRAIRQRLREALSGCLSAKCFAGPVETQIEFNPLKDTRPEFPVIYHVKIVPEDHAKLFLYLWNNSIELHCPDCLFVTGNLIKDDEHRQVVNKLTNDIADALQIQWHIAESAMEETTITNFDDFWRAYCERLFDRIEYEEIDA